MIYLIVQAKDLKDVPDPSPLSLSSILFWDSIFFF